MLHSSSSSSLPYAPRISLGSFNPLRVLQGAQVTLPCQVDANPPVKGIRWFKDGHQISNQFNHTINEAKISDSSVYSCQADNGIAPAILSPVGQQQLHNSPAAAAAAASSGSGYFFSNMFNSATQLGGAASAAARDELLVGRTAVEAQLYLQVLFPPKVQVRQSKSQPLNEGDYFSLNCSVEASPPAHEYIWTKADDPTFKKVMSAPNSLLEFQAISTSDIGNYTCTAFNRLEPSFITTTGGGGGGGGYLSYPSHLTHLQQQQQQQLQLQLQLQPGAAMVIEKSASASAMVQVRHKPGIAEISVGSNGETELGQKTLIQCRARPPGFPEPKYKFWKYQGPNQSAKLQLNKHGLGPIYTIHSAKSDDEAKYGCNAFNDLGQSQNEADGDLIVNEAPIIIHDETTRRQDDSRQPGEIAYSITVRGSGKPEPKVTWFHRSPLDGRRIELSNSANQQQLEQFQSKFKIETISKPEHNQLRAKYNVITTLTFKRPLEVDDRGQYSVEFSNNLSHSAQEDFQLHINHLTIPAIKNQPLMSYNQWLQQSGASPTNGLGGGGRQQQQQQQLSKPTKTKAGFDLGETVNLTCRVSAYPKPDFVWYANGPNNESILVDANPRYRTGIINIRDDIWESVLTFSQVHGEDYGDYMCVASHTEVIGDSIQIIVNLSRKTVPDAPSQLEAIETTQDSITLQWIPGFDGGFNQNQYFIQYAPDDNSGLSISKRFGASADSQGVVMATSSSSSNSQVDGNYLHQSAGGPAGNSMLLDNIDQQQQQQFSSWPKLYDCLAMNPCTINQLIARQAYVFRLRAKNELGFSEFSEELRASTRANQSQIPRILEASFDSANNILYFQIEQGSDYLLNNLNARIEYRSPSSNQQQLASTASSDREQQLIHQQAGETTASQAAQEINNQQVDLLWRPLTNIPMTQEHANARLNMQPDMEQLRITLCSRTNESLCGPDYVVSMKSAVSSFLQDQRGFSLSILLSTLTLIVVLTAFATTVHTCCLSGGKNKSKKADSIERIEGGGIDNKPASSANGAGGGNVNANNGGGITKSSHGSTTSTNSTSAGVGINGASSLANGLQSMDSINHGGVNGGALLVGGQNGNASDHSSDHSRQAKLDSMLPPNYNHYADHASLMMEQQLLQQQQGLMMEQQQQQQTNKLASPFGLPNGALLSVANQQHQQQEHSPMVGANGLAHFTYSAHGMDMHQQPTMSLDQHGLDHTGQSMMMSASGLDAHPDSNLWHASQQQAMLDDFNNYNALSNYQQQQSMQEQIMQEPAYGTTQGLMGAQQAIYDNGTNSGSQFQSYLSSNSYQQQQQQYQQELAVAQQQMYGTITRNGYSTSGSSNNNNNNANDNSGLMDSQQQQQQQQQQQYSAAGATNGLIPPAQMTPALNQQPQQESDYGTTGRSGRLIREIIV